MTVFYKLPITEVGGEQDTEEASVKWRAMFFALGIFARYDFVSSKVKKRILYPSPKNSFQ